MMRHGNGRIGGFCRLVALVVAGSLLSGCCSIFTGTTQTLTVGSEPEGAEILLNNVSMGVTPGVITVERKTPSPILQFKKEGYETAQVPISKNMNLWLIGDLVLCIPFLIPGLVAGVIDFADGAAFELYPANVNATLRPKAPAPIGERSPAREPTARAPQEKGGKASLARGSP